MVLDDQTLNKQTAEDDTEAEGSIIGGRYKLLEWIADGGMGRVHRAMQIATGRVVALKMMRAGSCHDEDRQRFHREATIASKLNHPNAVAIYDFGGTSRDQLYLVMEFVDGVSLDRMIQRSGNLAPHRVIAIFSQVCDLFAEAHSLGIVHRDLKPSNIMLTRSRTGTDVVKVLDFGIAKHIQMDEQGLTRPGQIFGSPIYMSPEQCEGKTVTHSTDIYSIGCMLYEALSGTPPFIGENAFKTMEMHLNQQAAHFKDLHSDLIISPELEGIVFRCLNKKPADRFGSVADLLLALQNLTKEPVRRHDRFYSYLIFAIPLLASLLLCFACFRWLSTKYKSAGQTPRSQSNVSKENKQQAPPYGTDDPMIKIAGEYDLGYASMNNGDVKNAIGYFSDTIVLSKAILKTNKDDYRALRMLASASQQRGYLYLKAGRFEDAVKDLSIAIEIRPDYRVNYLNRAAAYKELGQLKLHQMDLAMYNKLPELEPDKGPGWSARARRPRATP